MKLKGHIFNCLILASLVAACYLTSFSGSWQFDDTRCLVMNEALREPDFIKALPKLWNFSPGRVAGFASFWLDYRLHELNIFYWHLTNLALHLANCLLLYFLLLKVGERLEELRFKDLPVANLSLFGAAFFGLQPVQTQAVTYIVQRLELLGALAVLIFLLCLFPLCLKRGWQRLAAGALALLALGLGCLCKETVAMAPLIGGLGIWLMRKEDQRSAGTGLGFRHFLLGLLAFAILALGVLKLAGVFVLHPSPHLDFAPLERLWKDAPAPKYYFSTQILVWLTYLRLCFLPVGLRVEYDRPLQVAFSDPLAWLGLLFWAAVFCLAVKFRKKNPAWLMGLGTFALFLAPSSTLIPNGLYEHRLYGAMIGIALLLSYGLLPLAMKSKTAVALLSLALLFCGLQTARRNTFWRSPLALWQDTCLKSPDNWRARANYGQALLESERYNEALIVLKAASDMRPDNVETRYNLACCLANMGHLDEAVAELKTASAKKIRLPEIRKLVDETLKQLEDCRKARSGPAK